MQKQNRLRRIELSAFATFSCPVQIRVRPRLTRARKSLFLLGGNSRSAGIRMGQTSPGVQTGASDERLKSRSSWQSAKPALLQNENRYFEANFGFRTQGEFILRSLEVPEPKRCRAARADLQWCQESNFHNGKALQLPGYELSRKKA